MNDMQDFPPDVDENQTASVQPLGHELHLSSNALIQSPDSEAFEPSRMEEAFKTAGIRGLLPKALAKEEQAVRLKETHARRRNGIPLVADEIRNDLSKIMSHLITQLSAHTAGVSHILKLPSQALLYAEHTAFYTMKDYPRIFENDTAILALWDALENIYKVSADWRQDENRGDPRAVIVSISRMAKASMRALHSATDDDVKPNISEIPDP
jgi:hypothetical protein